jgi:adenosylhomocysteine nucleosidase
MGMALPGDVERVAVIAAMVQELKPTVRALSLERQPLGDGSVFVGQAGGRRVAATVTSMGTQAATEVTERLLDVHPADYVIMVGIAGGISPALSIGEVIMPTAVVNEMTDEEVHPIPLGDRTPAGTLLTTDLLHNQPEEMDAFIERGIIAVDMETAAVGAVAEGRGLSWSAIRAISDRAGDPAVDETLLGLSKPDGTARPGAVAKLLVTKPGRIPTLARLGRGMQAAVRSSTDLLLETLRA